MQPVRFAFKFKSPDLPIGPVLDAPPHGREITENILKCLLHHAFYSLCAGDLKHEEDNAKCKMQSAKWKN